jgi:hypothetical protein
MSKQAMKNVEERSAPERPERDPVSAFGHEMLALFRGPLAEVRFPDLDRAVLEEGAAELMRAQLEVETLERALEAARLKTQSASVAFGQTATRALAYARVLATGQPAVEAALAASPLLASAGGSTHASGSTDTKREEEKKRRGRPKKGHSTAELLPMGAEEPQDAADVIVAA